MLLCWTHKRCTKKRLRAVKIMQRSLRVLQDCQRVNSGLGVHGWWSICAIYKGAQIVGMQSLSWQHPNTRLKQQCFDLILHLCCLLSRRKSIDSKYKQGSQWYSLPPKLCLQDWPTKASPKMTDWTMKRLQSTSTESSHSQPSARKPRSAHIRRAEAFQLENSVMYFTAFSGYILQIRQLLQSFPPVLFAASGARSFRWWCPVLWRHANHLSNWLLPHSASQVMVQFKQKK